jgi:oligoendopeptidase F
MIELMADLFSEGFGGNMDLDRERVGITWGTFTTHLYIDFYSFQYAIGISAANAIAKRILNGEANAARITSISSKRVHPNRPWKYTRSPAWI